MNSDPFLGPWRTGCHVAIAERELVYVQQALRTAVVSAPFSLINNISASIAHRGSTAKCAAEETCIWM